MPDATIDRAPGVLEVVLEDHGAHVVLRRIDDRYFYAYVSTSGSDGYAHGRQYPGSISRTARAIKDAYQEGGLEAMMASEILTVSNIAKAVHEARIGD